MRASPYLTYPLPRIGEFLCGVKEVAFVPYAAVTFSYAEYERRVQERFSTLGIRRAVGAPRGRPRGGDPPCRSDLRRRRQHLRAGQEDAGAWADAGDPQPREGRRALCGVVGGQQRGLPCDLDDQRHADRRTCLVPCRGGGEVPDQSPLSRRQSRGTCWRDA